MGTTLRTGARVLAGLLLAVCVAAPAAAAGTDIEIISHGDRVALSSHLVDGKYVLFDFYADWCSICKSIEPEVRALAGRFDDRLAVRMIDIVDWESQVAAQYQLESIPHMKLYSSGGALIAEGAGQDVLRVLKNELGVRTMVTPSLIPLLAFALVGVIVVWRMVASGRRADVGDERELREN